METDDDLDTHICLSCQLPIIGLENYVFHKKHECSAKKRKHSQPTDLTQPIADSYNQVSTAQGVLHNSDGSSLQVSPGQFSPAICQAMALQLAPVASQTMNLLTKSMTTTVATSGLNTGVSGSYSAVNPNMVLNTVTTAINNQGHDLSVSETDEMSKLSNNLTTTTPSIMDFLSTLELQCRPHTSPGKLGSSTMDGLDDQNVGLESRVPDGLKLANLLNDLNFDSDSEGFDMPSDAEDFLNFTEEDYHELNANYMTGSAGGKGKSQGDGKGHGKGKFKGKGECLHPSGKNRKGSLPGKWRPGERISGKLASAGRWMSIGKRHYEEMSSDGEQAEPEATSESTAMPPEQDTKTESGNSDAVQSEPQQQQEVDGSQEKIVLNDCMASEKTITTDVTSTVANSIDSMEATAVDVLLKINSKVPEPNADHTYDGTTTLTQDSQDHTYDTACADKGSSTPLRCEPCDRLFKNALALHSHMRSSQHKAVVAGLPVVKSCESADKQFHVECSGCQRSFNNKYNYARHLVSALHLKRSKSSLLHLDPAFQRLLLPLKQFQCRICLFYCNTHQDFLDHISTAEHGARVDELVGPMTCTRCKYSSRSCREIYEHFITEDHMKVISNSDRPCVLREVRHNLPCVHCGKMFHSATKLQQHYNMQHPIKQEKCKGVPKQTFCDKCSRNFSTHHNWVQHVRRKHRQDGEQFRCDICNTKNFADQSYLDHHYKSRKHLDNVLKASSIANKDCNGTERHNGRGRPALNKAENGKVYKCKECDYSSKVYTDLRPHYIEVHSKNIVYDFTCETCGFSFDTQLKLDKHLQSRKHLQTEKEAKEANHQAIACSTCGHKFYSQDRYSLHLLSHKTMGLEPTRGKKGLNRLKGVPERFHTFVLKLPSGHTKDVQCPECKEWCKCNNIVPHIRGRHGDPNDLPYKCNFCPKSFPSSASLYRHHKAHLGMKSFLCKICSKAYRSKSDLETHELMSHRSELNIVAKFQCFFCNESFMQRNRLNIHMKKKHEKERAFPCRWPGCHRQFIYRSEYNQHMRVHTGERPFLCDLCGYATKTKVQLRRHEKSHTGESNYKCKYCTYSASHSWGLRRHMRIHSGVKPYKCPHCDYRCNCHTNLRHHIITSKRHPGRFLYHCKECTFATNKGTEFQQHCIELHSIPPEKVENVAEYCGVYLPEEDSRDVLEGSQILPVPERKPRTQKSSLFIASGQNNASSSCVQNILELDMSDQKTFASEHHIIGQVNPVKTEQSSQETIDMMPQVHQIIFQQQASHDDDGGKAGQEQQTTTFIPQIVSSHEVIQNSNAIIQQELHHLSEPEVTQIPFTSDLTHLLAPHEGIEHTGAVVELRMDDEYTFTASRSGQTLQVVGQDNKPIQFFYA